MARYIDADELDVVVFQGKSEEFIDGAMAVLEMIDKMPTVDKMPTEQTAEWIMEEKGIITTKYRCSKCNRVVWDDTGYDVAKDYPYCHCGAKMKGGEDG